MMVALRSKWPLRRAKAAARKATVVLPTVRSNSLYSNRTVAKKSAPFMSFRNTKESLTNINRAIKAG